MKRICILFVLLGRVGYLMSEIALPQPPVPPAAFGSVTCADPAVLAMVGNLQYLPVLYTFIEDRSASIARSKQEIEKKDLIIKEIQVQIEQTRDRIQKIIDPHVGAIADIKKELLALKESLAAQEHTKSGALCNARAAAALLGPMAAGLERGGVTKTQFDSMLCYFDKLQECVAGKPSVNTACGGLTDSLYTGLLGHRQATAKDEQGNYKEPIYRVYPATYFERQVQNLSHAIESSHNDFDQLKHNVLLLQERVQERIRTLKAYQAQVLEMDASIDQQKNQIVKYHEDINALVASLQEDKQAILLAQNALLELKKRLTSVDSSVYAKCPQYLVALLS